VSAVTAGRTHTCALLDSGGVRCFGNNGAGQLGDGRETFRVFRPKEVVGLDDAVEIAAHPEGWMTCARRRARDVGEVVCWGSRGTPQDDGGLELLGREPVALPPLEGASAASHLTVGLWEVCVIADGGAARCWAESLAHVRGEADAPAFGAARAVSGLPPVVELAMGVAHACARTEAGHVLCWGSNEYGQLGDGTTDAREQPLLVALDGVLDGVEP
jgi:alpha-tubulin suppressor-like RCC1 family protein